LLSDSFVQFINGILDPGEETRLATARRRCARPQPESFSAQQNARYL
jgi:hypothetical protein